MCVSYICIMTMHLCMYFYMYVSYTCMYIYEYMYVFLCTPYMYACLWIMFACLYLGSLQCASIWLFQPSLVFSLSSPLRQPTFSTITQLNRPPHYFSFLFIAHILNIQYPHCKTDITCPILQVEIKKSKAWIKHLK